MRGRAAVCDDVIVVIGGPALTITLHFLADPLDRLARLSRRSSSVSSRPISAGKRLAVIAPVSGPIGKAYVVGACMA